MSDPTPLTTLTVTRACGSVEIFVDGSCLRNPGPGGWGILIRQGGREETTSAGYRMTTNNRMELMSAVMALRSAEPGRDLTISTDSGYLYHGITRWRDAWKSAGWRRKNGPLVNLDLWLELDRLVDLHSPRWCWIRGHSGHPENDLCDVLARRAASSPTLDDVIYLLSRRGTHLAAES